MTLMQSLKADEEHRKQKGLYVDPEERRPVGFADFVSGATLQTLRGHENHDPDEVRQQVDMIRS